MRLNAHTVRDRRAPECRAIEEERCKQKIDEHIAAGDEPGHTSRDFLQLMQCCRSMLHQAGLRRESICRMTM